MEPKDRLPKRRVIKLLLNLEKRDKQILEMEDDGYVLKQITVSGDENKLLYGLFVRKNIRTKKK